MEAPSLIRRRGVLIRRGATMTVQLEAPQKIRRRGITHLSSRRGESTPSPARCVVWSPNPWDMGEERPVREKIL